MQLLQEFFYSDSRAGLNLWEWLFVLLVKSFVILSVCVVVALAMTIPSLAIWAVKPVAIFLFDHWQWTLVGIGFLILVGIINTRRKRHRKVEQEKARVGSN